MSFSISMLLIYIYLYLPKYHNFCKWDSLDFDEEINYHWNESKEKVKIILLNNILSFSGASGKHGTEELVKPKNYRSSQVRSTQMKWPFRSPLTSDKSRRLKLDLGTFGMGIHSNNLSPFLLRRSSTKQPVQPLLDRNIKELWTSPHIASNTTVRRWIMTG